MKLVGLTLLCWATLLVSGCSQRLERETNVVLITVDTLRSDHLGLYGYFRDTSPVLDSLAVESVVFDHCYSPVPTTLPSHLSILTGTHPLEHGVVSNWCDVRPCFVSQPGFRSIAEVLSEAGYRTGGFVSAAPLKHWSGLSTGFDLFDQPEDEQRTAEVTNTKVFDWLRQESDDPFFLWVHYYDAHADYTPPAPYDTMFQTDQALETWLADHHVWHKEMNFHPGSAKIYASEAHNLYDGEIRYLDQQIGRLFDQLRGVEGRWENTVVIVVGDHGEGLGQRGYVHHGGLWDDQLRVPFMIRFPGALPRRVHETTTVMDLLPTLSAQLDLDELRAMSPQWSGRDALVEPMGDREILAVTATWLGQANKTNYSWTDGRTKFLTDLEGSEWIYRLDEDPSERDRIDVGGNESADSLRHRLGSALEQLLNRGTDLRAEPGSAVADSIDEGGLRAELKALGYIE